MAKRWTSWFVELLDRWIGYRVTEKEILDWMKRQGYSTSANKLSQVHLYALQRPGWIQVFLFQVEVSKENGPRYFYGAMRSDERYGEPEIKLFENQWERLHQLQEWSVGLIVRR
ncbi:MAG: hypothetical protein JNL67_11910 [Planctomycetaceae bacterium]|nr:hypothetical protein [Planctomycetaceae bacterium]